MLYVPQAGVRHSRLRGPVKPYYVPTPKSVETGTPLQSDGALAHHGVARSTLLASRDAAARGARRISAGVGLWLAGQRVLALNPAHVALRPHKAQAL